VNRKPSRIWRAPTKTLEERDMATAIIIIIFVVLLLALFFVRGGRRRRA
jgi:hypothetical protein